MLGELVGKARQSFIECNAWMNIWEGAVSSSKTVTCDFAWIDFIIHGPKGNLLMVGKSERTLKRNVIDPMVEMFGARQISTVGMGKGEIHMFGRLVYLVGANDERAEQKIRGASLVGAYCDEITLYPESFFQMLLTRLRSPGARLFGTTNPDTPYHWFKVNFLDRKEELDLKSWKFTLDDNPYLEPEYVENLKRTYTGLWYRRFILGEWCIAEGAVYDGFNIDIHVVDKPPFAIQDYYVAIDYGTNNPCCFLLIGVNGKQAYCVKEYYYDSVKEKRQKTDAEYADDLYKFVGSVPIRSIIIDPSAASFKVELLRRHWPIRDAINDVIDGIRTVSVMLGQGRYHIHKDCTNHIKEFMSYVWDARSITLGEDRPKKENDHSLDACRYCLHTVVGREVYAINFANHPPGQYITFKGL